MNEPRILDAKKFKDPRSRSFGLSPEVLDLPVEKKTWGYPSPRIDQGREGHCVGFGWSNELAGEPVRIGNITDAFAHGMFYAAQNIDRTVHGLNFPDGATVLAGAKAVKAAGFMDEYRWAFGIDQALQALMNGPIVLGIDWLGGMYVTDKRGLVELSGDRVGGHCITAFGFIPGMRFGLKRYDVIPWVNSWGPSYGKRGIGYIKVEDLDNLLRRDGEVCVPVHRTVPKKG